MITVTEEARELFREIENPEDTVLHIDPVTTNEADGDTRVRLSIGEPRSDDQVILHEGEDLVRIARPVSEALNGSTYRPGGDSRRPGLEPQAARRRTATYGRVLKLAERGHRT